MKRKKELMLLTPDASSISGIIQRYTLYDQFTIALAAGSVNGTLAEPVGGARTVTDTNSKISIAGGVLDFATGAATNDGAWWPIQTRVLGKTFLGTLKTTSGTSGIGWDVNQSGIITDHLRFTGTTLQLVYAAASLVTLDSFSTGVSYKIAYVLRTSGTFQFIKGGAFTNWTLLFPLLSGTGSVYPGLYNVSSFIGTADNIRVPKRLFIPVPLQSDGFSADTTDGAGNAEANGPVGSVWTGDTWGAAGGLASNTPTQGDELLTNGNMEAGDPPSSWTGDGVGTILDGVADERTGGSGIQSLSITSGVSDVGKAQQQVTSPAGSWVLGSVWAKRVTTASPRLVILNSGGGTLRVGGSTTSTSWSQIFASVYASANVYLLLDNNSVTGEGRYDDASLKILTLSTLFRSLVHSSANVLCDVEIVCTAGTQAGLVLNLDSAASPANFIIAYIDGTDCKLDKCVAGVYTNMISAAVTYSAAAVLRVVKDGTAYRLFYNNAAVGSVTTIADAGIVSNTLHGLFSTYSANTFDNYCCWARGNEGQYGGLDAL